MCHLLHSSLVLLQDYPGLLRVIAWVVNGLDLLVENARCVVGICAALGLTLELLPIAHTGLDSSVFCVSKDRAGLQAGDRR